MIRPAVHRLLVALIVALAVAFVGCDASETPPGSGSPGDHPATLAGTSWIVAAVNGQAPPIRGSEPAIAFDGTTARGSGGCNQFGGRYAYDPVTGRLRFDELGMTAMACAERPRNDYETLFMQSLARVEGATLAQDGGLTLTGAGARIDLIVVGPTVTD
jgi:heat shock protein HslJ